jgi:hypothetical protein
LLSINSTVAKTGKFTATGADSVQDSGTEQQYIDMISKIRIKDRSETVRITKYETIHYGLKPEFELRSVCLTKSVQNSLIQDNAKFFLDVLQSKPNSPRIHVDALSPFNTVFTDDSNYCNRTEGLSEQLAWNDAGKQEQIIWVASATAKVRINR